MDHTYAKMKSPVGDLHLFASATHLVALVFDANLESAKTKYQSKAAQNHPILQKAMKQLNEYFCGKRKSFDLPIQIDGTEFQKSVWSALQKIPYGRTQSYQEQAKAIQNPKAVRAVGRTNGLNPIGIVIPCHRVIGKSGKLTGYAGGLQIKEQLLMLEQAAARA